VHWNVSDDAVAVAFTVTDMNRYIIIAIAFWVYPETKSDDVVGMIKAFFH